MRGVLLVLVATALAAGCALGPSLGVGSSPFGSSAAATRGLSTSPTLVPVVAPSPQAPPNPSLGAAGTPAADPNLFASQSEAVAGVPAPPGPQTAAPPVKESALQIIATTPTPPGLTPTPLPVIAAATATPFGGQPADVALPVRLRIAAVAVDAEFEYVGLTPDGAMGAPKDPDRVAWYKLGPRPGQSGNAAIAGHVDWAGKIRAFWFLKQLGPGDDVEVVSADGKSYHFQVQWLRWFDASGGDVDEVYGSTGVPELTLITCGGTFDRQSHQYLSRLVVRAAMR